jgi:hypothetical protein
MLQRIESVEQDIRQWGQRQMMALDGDAMRSLATLCDRLRDIRADMRRDSPGPEPDAICPACSATCGDGR